MIQNFDFWSEFRRKNKKNQFFSQNSEQKSKFWIIEFFLNVYKSMPTKFEGSILKNEKALSFWSWKNTFLRKMCLKLQRTMYLGLNSKTEVVKTWDVLGIFTFCKNWVELHTIGYWKTQKWNSRNQTVSLKRGCSPNPISIFRIPVLFRNAAQQFFIGYG